MALRYDLTAVGLSGVEYKVEIYDSTFTGNSTTLTGDDQFILFDGGEKDDVGLHPLWPTELRIFIRDSEDISPLFGAEDKDIRVEVSRTDNSVLVYKGFLLTDFFQDAPYSHGEPLVELRAFDGLPTLKQSTVGDLGYTEGGRDDPDDRSVWRAVQDMLNNIFSTDLDIEFGTEWYPHADGDQLDASTLPETKIEFDPDNYRVQRRTEDQDRSTDHISQYEALKDLLKSMGCTLRQRRRGTSDVVWHVRQRSALGDGVTATGSLKVWIYNDDGTIRTGYPKTIDLDTDIGSEEFNVDHIRGFERRREEVGITFNHVPIDSFITNPGFEADGGWSISGSTEFDASMELYDDHNEVPDGVTGENERLLHVRQTILNGATVENVYGAEQADTKTVITPLAGTHGRLQFDVYEGVLEYTDGSTEDPPQGAARIRLTVDDSSTKWYLRNNSIEVRGEALGGGRLLLKSALPVNLPKKGRYPIRNPNAPSKELSKAFITLDKRAKKGDTTLYGEISDNVNPGWNLHFPEFSSTAKDFNVYYYVSARQALTRVDIRVDWKDGNDNLLSGDLQAKLGIRKYDRASTSDDLDVFYDDVNFTLEVNEGKLDRTITEASVTEAGERDATSHQSGTGPTDQNLSRYRLKGETGTSFDVANNYQIGAYADGAAKSGDTLEEVHARERLRYLRNHTERLQITLQPRDKSPILDGADFISFDGKNYTISALKSSPSQGALEVTLLEFNDLGTSGITLTRDFAQSEEEASGASGGGTSSSGGGTTVTSNIERIVLDATGGDVSEDLPSPGVKDAAIVVRKDTSGNTATINDPNSNDDIEWSDHEDSSSIDLGHEEAFTFVSDGDNWYVSENQNLTASAEPVTSDDGTKNSPALTLKANYDGSGTAADGIVTATARDLDIYHRVTDPNTPVSEAVVEVAGTEVAWIDDSGNIRAKGDVIAFDSGTGSAPSASSNLQAVDPLSLDTGTDPDTISFVQDIENAAGTTVVQGATEIQFKGSGVNGVTNPSGSRVEVDIAGGSGSIDLEVDNVDQASDVSVLDFNAGTDINISAAAGDDTGEQDITITHADTSAQADVSTTGADIVDSVTLDGRGHVTGLATRTLQHSDFTIAADDHHAKYTDEEAQDAVGTILSTQFTYDDVGNAINLNPHANTTDAHHTQPTTGDGLTGTTTFAVDSTVARTNAAETFDNSITITADGTAQEGYVLEDTANNFIGEFRNNGGDANFRAAAGASFGIGISGTGAAEIKIVDNGGAAHNETILNANNASDVAVEVARFESTQRVGIGGVTSPSYALEVSGDARASGEVEAFLSSDERLKKNLSPMGSALDTLLGLTGYRFEWREDNATQPHKRGTADVGLVAQEVQGVLPEAVKEMGGGHSEGYLAVSYDRLVPLLIEAVKELEAEVQYLRNNVY